MGGWVNVRVRSRATIMIRIFRGKEKLWDSRMRNSKLRCEDVGARTDHHRRMGVRCLSARDLTVIPHRMTRSRCAVEQFVERGLAVPSSVVLQSMCCLRLPRLGLCRSHTTVPARGSIVPQCLTQCVINKRRINAIRQDVMVRHPTGSDKHNVLTGAMWGSFNA